MDAVKMKARNTPIIEIWSSDVMTLPLLLKVDPEHSNSKDTKEKKGDGKDQ